MKCPYCGSRAIFMDSKIIYGKSFGMAYVCKNFPACDSYVGVHKGSNRPLGIMANSELREWKKKAHSVFDPLWKNGMMKRGQAYEYLSKALKIKVEECHIGMFDIDKCMRTYELLNHYTAKD